MGKKASPIVGLLIHKLVLAEKEKKEYNNPEQVVSVPPTYY